MAETINIKVELELAGTWTDVTEDVLSVDKLFAFRGKRGKKYKDRVDETGTLVFALNNSVFNSGGAQGYYSPAHSSRRTGFETGIMVRVSFQHDDRWIIKWSGFIPPNGIVPAPGANGENKTYITAYDIMWQYSNRKIIGTITPQTNKRIDECVPLLISGLPMQPDDTEYLPGDSNFTYPLSNIGATTAIRSALLNLANSEAGFIGTRYNAEGCTLYVHNRNYRGAQDVARIPKNPTTCGFLKLAGGGYLLLQNGGKLRLRETESAAFSSELHDLKPGYGADIVNNVVVRSYPVRIDANPVVLWSLDNEIQLTSGTSVEIWARYIDPTGKTKSVNAKDQVTPVATTDYTFYSGSGGTGSNITANLTVTATHFLDVTKLTLTPTANGYVNFLRVRGIGIYRENVAESNEVDNTSINTYGEYQEIVDMPYQSDPTLAANLGAYILNAQIDEGLGYVIPRNSAETITFHANRDYKSAQAFLTLEPDDKITVSETVNALSTVEHFIQGVEWTATGLGGGAVAVDVTYYLKDAIFDNYRQELDYDLMMTYIDSANATTNYSTSPLMYLSSTKRTLVDYVPFGYNTVGRRLTAARLTLYVMSCTSTVTISAYATKQSWSYTDATWNKYDASNNWATAGCDNTTSDRDGTICGSVTISAGFQGWIDIDLDPAKFSSPYTGIILIAPTAVTISNGTGYPGNMQLTYDIV